MGWKALQNLPHVRMRFYVKDERDACRNMSVMSGHTGRQANMSLCIRFYDPDVSFVSEQAVSIN